MARPSKYESPRSLRTLRGVSDRVEQRVVWDVESMLESVLVEPLAPGYTEALSRARDLLRDELDTRGEAPK